MEFGVTKCVSGQWSLIFGPAINYLLPFEMRAAFMLTGLSLLLATAASPILADTTPSLQFSG